MPLVLLLPGAVHADLVIPCSIRSLEQNDQDVEIVLRIDELSFDRLFKLTFGDDVEQRILFTDRAFHKDESIEVHEFCHNGLEYLERCKNEPELNCVDCDGDDVAECPDDCENSYLFSIIHTCAPEGLIKYMVYYSSDEGEWFLEDEEEIRVSHPFLSCSPGEYEQDEYPVQEEGTGNCSVSMNTSAPELLPLIIMLTIGLVAVFRMRNR